jgi:ligand-binding sensor domain-containing protein/signal transduction histidine kinase
LGLSLSLARVGRAADYLVDVWDTENHLPNSSVTAITQTPDGYLWVGTYNGLARFDGLRFVTFDPVNTPALGHARIRDLFVDPGGTLWINTYRGGLTSYRNGAFRREWEGAEFDLHTSLAYSSSNEVIFVTQFGQVLRRGLLEPDKNSSWRMLSPPAGRERLVFQCADREGRLWFVTRAGHIVRLVGSEFQDLPPHAVPAGNRTLMLAADARGGIWAGTDQGLARWNGRWFETMTPTNGEPTQEVSYLLPVRDGGVWVLADGRLRKQVGRRWEAEADEWRGLLGSASRRTMGMHEDHQGGVWFHHYGNGLFHVTPNGQFERLTSQDGLPGDRVWAWFEGREGDIWVGVDRGGLARLREKRFQVIGAAEGLHARAALSVCEDENGAMWFGTSGGGLCRWSGGRLEEFAVGGETSANYVFSVVPQPGNGLWLSASAGEDLYVFRNRQLQRAPWEVHGVKCLLVDRAGRVWMGTKSGLNWWTPEQRHTFSAREGVVTAAVRALAETADGTVWCGTEDGGLLRCEPGRLQAFRPADALAGQPVWSLLADRDGIWAGTFRGGLLRFKDGRFARLTTEQGLPDDVVSQVLDDGHGQLWLGTQAGICRVAKSAVNACADGKQRYVDCVTYGRQDGLPSLECAGNYQPACWRARDGRLWFATVKGMVSVKPEELKANPVAPEVAIEEFRVDGERIPLSGDRLVVPPGHKQFEFRFTALSFIASDNVRFRYRLEGLETEWVEAGTRRSAQYSHLRAGTYQFRVLACNNDGVWNVLGRQLAFTVRPHVYETAWFLAAAALGVVASVAATVRAVTSRKYRLALARLEQQHAVERDRARIAKDIHDDLGAGLTQITLLSELAQRESPDQAGTHLQRISDSARKMTRAVDEIVWAVDPQHDTLSGLLDYISAYTEDFLRTAGIRCRMDLPAELPACHVAAEQRYHLFLALKETLNNIVKHAHATEVWLHLRLETASLTLSVEDNGCGLPTNGDGVTLVSMPGQSPPRTQLESCPSRSTATLIRQRLAPGHGLPNLEQRLAAIGGKCTVHSAPAQGTTVELSVRLEPTVSPIVAIGQRTTAG